MAEEEEENKNAPKSGRRWWRKKRSWLLIVFLAFLGLLVWLDGPGWRIIGKKVAAKYLPDMGLAGEIELGGRLSGGEIEIGPVDLAGDKMIQSLKLGRLRVTYDPTKVVKGEIESIVVEGLEADIDLALAEEKPEEEKEPFDINDLPGTLRTLRGKISPLEIRLSDISADIHRGDETVVKVAPTSLVHESGADRFALDLGAIELPGGRVLDSQQAALDWAEASLTLDRFEVMPDLAVRDLKMLYPEGGTPRFAVDVALLDTVLAVRTDLRQATVKMSGEPLDVREAARVFAADVPVEATVRSLEIEATGIAAGIDDIDGTLKLGLADVSYDDWTSARLDLDAKLEGELATTNLTGEALGSPLDLSAETTISRADNFLPTGSDIELAIPQLHQPLTVVRDRFIGTTKEVPTEKPAPRDRDIEEGVDAPVVAKPGDDGKPGATAQVIESPDREADREPEVEDAIEMKTVKLPPVPDSALAATAHVDFADGKPSAATTALEITSPTDAPTISLDGAWDAAGKILAKLGVPGLDLNATYETGPARYAGKLALDSFDPRSVAAWAAPFGTDLPEGMRGSLTWKGAGDVKAATHEGDFDITSFELARPPGTGPLKIFATGSYAWPRMVDLEELNVQLDAQKIEGALHLEDRRLKLQKLAWSDGDDILLNGTADIPVGENPADWKAILRSGESVSIDLQSTELPLTKLHPFLGEETRFPPDSLAKLDVKLSGSPANPILNAVLDVTKLGIVGQDKVPPTDIHLEATGEDQTLKLTGAVNATGYPPAEIFAVTNWNPDQWAEDPATLRQAEIDASAKISDLNLKLVSDYVPDARRIEGVVNIDLEVGGTVAEPEPSGTVTLGGARFEMKDEALPRLKEGEVKIVATPGRVAIEKFSARISGGLLKIGGGIDLTDYRPSALDIRISATALPAVRDDSMIVRVSSALTLAGPWESATLSGSVNVVDSLYFKDIELLPIGVPFNQPSEPSLPALDAPEAGDLTAGVPAPFRDWKLDLSLGTVNPFLIRGNLATGEVVLDAKVGGTVANPRPTGGATIRGVEAELPFSKLNITEGKVDFRPDQPFDPVLDIRGESTVRPYQIDVYIYGPLSDPKVLPTSNPPLPETEIMTLLATGTTTSGFEDPDAATARAAQLFIEELRRGRIKNVKWLKPALSVLEDVDFQVGEKDPYTSTKYNSATVNLTDNLLFRAGLSEDGNTRTALTYLLRFK